MKNGEMMNGLLMGIGITCLFFMFLGDYIFYDDEILFIKCHKESIYEKSIDLNELNQDSLEFKCEIVRRKLMSNK